MKRFGLCALGIPAFGAFLKDRLKPELRTADREALHYRLVKRGKDMAG
jgi:hypothetical protein